MSQPLLHVYWIGGSPCSGKSSVTKILAEKYSFQVYACDDHFGRHMQQATPDERPALHKLTKMSWDDIWMRPVDALLQDELKVYWEESAMIHSDLKAMSADTPIIAEGAALLPEIIMAHAQTYQFHKMVYLVPSEEFQRRVYPQREWIQGILKACTNPEQAFKNWMSRDIAFASHVTGSAKTRNFLVIVVDGKTGIADIAKIVEKHFRLVKAED